jgi:tetratricopeptide (TPR) repeat protein
VNRSRRFIHCAALGLSALTLCSANPQAPPARLALGPLPAAVLLPSDASVVEQSIRFLESRIKRDPDDFIASNKLAGYYLQRVRETGDLTYLTLAAQRAKASLAAIPSERNTAGLMALAQVEFVSHDFETARDHARRLIELHRDESAPYQLLGDSLLELGDYDGAKAAFRQMTRLGADHGLTRVATEQRTARLAALRGDTAAAQYALRRALILALAIPAPPRETVAWCRWQLGETAFSIGDYAAAEQHYRDTLTTFPDYFRALASLGRIRAARGDLAEAIKHYERAVYILPDPTFVAALGDLFKVTGRDREAAAQYALVEAIAQLSAASGLLYNRQQALFHADHDIKPQEAYANAAKEYAVRKDIYGADALAWTALKAGKLLEAQAAMRAALRMGTQDAKLFFHAGMIASALGDRRSARDYLRHALTLSPQFDPLQASIARKTLMNDEASLAGG